MSTLLICCLGGECNFSTSQDPKKHKHTAAHNIMLSGFPASFSQTPLSFFRILGVIDSL